MRYGWIVALALLAAAPAMAEDDNDVSMNTVAGIQRQAYRIYPWMRQSEARERWIADRISEMEDRRRGMAATVRITPTH